MSMIDGRKRIECVPNPKSTLANAPSNKTEATLTCNKMMDVRKIFRYGKPDQRNTIEGKLDNNGDVLTVNYKPDGTEQQFENMTLHLEDSQYCVSTPKRCSELS